MSVTENFGDVEISVWRCAANFHKMILAIMKMQFAKETANIVEYLYFKIFMNDLF